MTFKRSLLDIVEVARSLASATGINWEDVIESANRKLAGVVSTFTNRD